MSQKHFVKLFFLSLIGTFVCVSLNTKTNKTILPKALKNLTAMQFIPEAKINGETVPAFYMFRHELSNIDYAEFLYWLKDNDKKEALQIATIDTSLWQDVEATGNDLFAKAYHKKKNFPIVNISKAAAELYCQWLSDIWNNQQIEYTLSFRLPTELEWEYAAAGGPNTMAKPYPWSGAYCRNAKGNYLAQHKAFGLPFGPVKVDAFLPNNFGLYNMVGNVAEMVSDANMAKGGSWNDNGDHIKITSKTPIQKSPQIGFRPVMTFVKR